MKSHDKIMEMFTLWGVPFESQKNIQNQQF